MNLNQIITAMNVAAGDHINSKLYVGICILAVIAIVLILAIRHLISARRDREDED